jgi:hypothetical protein
VVRALPYRRAVPGFAVQAEFLSQGFADCEVVRPDLWAVRMPLQWWPGFTAMMALWSTCTKCNLD